MRRPRAACAVLATVFLSLLAAGFAGPATAGGPTSVLLVAPGTGRIAALYTGTTDYHALSTLVGMDNPVVGSLERPAGGADALGGVVTLTWLVHDVEAWRVDEVFLDATGGPMISTHTDPNGGGDIWAGPTVWHRASNGKALAALLSRLNVGRVANTSAAAGTTPTTGVLSATTGVPAPLSAAATAAKPSAADSDSDGLPGWVWGPVGALLGAVLALTLRRRPTPETDNPRHNPAETLPSHPS
jgi:hypothetical protein